MLDVAGAMGDWVSAGAGAGGGAVVAWKLFDWFGTRVDKREDMLTRMAQLNAEAQASLVLNLQDQITKVCARLDTAEAELGHCRDQHAAAIEELGKLRGIVQGMGDAKQEAAPNCGRDADGQG